MVSTLLFCSDLLIISLHQQFHVTFLCFQMLHTVLRVIEAALSAPLDVYEGSSPQAGILLHVLVFRGIKNHIDGPFQSPILMHLITSGILSVFSFSVPAYMCKKGLSKNFFSCQYATF